MVVEESDSDPPVVTGKPLEPLESVGPLAVVAEAVPEVSVSDPQASDAEQMTLAKASGYPRMAGLYQTCPLGHDLSYTS